ncbi:MAG: primosomal protein N' [Eggerthellaceae bacterium]|nr:primosomal protein N' [Eggerthellaceae bacterium]
MRIARVVIDSLAKFADNPYSYIVPDGIDAKIGSCVLVPFGHRKTIGYVVEVKEPVEPVDYTVFSKFKKIEGILSDPLFGLQATQAAEFISENYITSFKKSIKCFTPSGAVPRVSCIKGEMKVTYPIKNSRRTKMLQETDSDEKKTLTQEQRIAYDVIINSYEKKDGRTVLLDGVTGSGKTEVYLQAIDHVLSQGQNAVVLIPEISLSPQMLARFSARFRDKVGLLHSKMVAAERLDVWRKVQAGNIRIVLGARSALFSPLENVGIYIIDEEHENTYKQESSPRYNAKEVAKFLVKKNGACLVLGSATPSIESLYQAKYNTDWSYVRMKNRTNNMPLPEIQLVDMTNEFASGHCSIFSVALTKAIKDEIEAGHKVVLLLNHRGFSKFVLCRDCGYVPRCPHCEVSLTFHEKGNYLKCHHCGYSQNYYSKCPECGCHYLGKFGSGTEKLESELEGILQEKFSERHSVELIRMDSDTTKRKGSHERLLKKFLKADRAILLGTQMIAKGLDFEDVTLVGVISADTALNLPDFRAQERSFNLISQVAGRAGRSLLEGRVIVQSYRPQEPAVKYACAYNRNAFLKEEIAQRRAFNYPPFTRLCNIVFSASDYDACKQASEDAYHLIKQVSIGFQDFETLPAVPCTFVRLNKKFRFHILLKFKDIAHVRKVSKKLEDATINNRAISFIFDVDPYSML